MSAHTPGPWTVGERRSILGRAFDKSEKQIVDQVRGGSREAADANARLIASAPDLLAALKTIRAYREGYERAEPCGLADCSRCGRKICWPRNDPDTPMCELCVIDSALAKAEGAESAVPR